MPDIPLETGRILSLLTAQGVSPILYGSQGVSLYLGAFKQFGDIDLLVERKWLEEDWAALIAIMHQLGFGLQDEHEHEFSGPAGLHVAFAGNDILVRDGIADSVQAAIQDVALGTTMIRTLTPTAFLRAYEFSAKDGYRRDTRGKKDGEVIARLQRYLRAQAMGAPK